jgi:alpha-L-rhamnosidase
MLAVTTIRCEYETNPIAVPTDRPRFGWVVEASTPGFRQRAYQVQVARRPDFGDALWDTGWVKSAQSQQVTYGGPALAPRTRYHLRIRVSSADDEGPWSLPTWFEISRLSEPWLAPFVSAEGAEDGPSSRPTYLRKVFTLPEDPQTARVYATALGLYELWINGKRVGEALFAPGWTNYRKRLAYQTYDVTALLKRGSNVLGAVLGAGWYKGEVTWLETRNLYGSRTALSLELRVQGATGETTLRTDKTWRGSHGPIQYSELYHGETYDARQEMPGWSAPEHDDAAWKPVVALETPAAAVVAQDGPPVLPQKPISARDLIRTPAGETVLDFGQNLTGWVRFSVRGKAGDRVVLRHAEILDSAGNFYTENMRKARNRIEYILRGGGTETFEPHFTFQGFRYVHVEQHPGTPDPADFQAVPIHSAMEETLTFECSEPNLNQLHHNILWGWKGNALDVPTDCPQRDERLGWTGDAQVFAGTATSLTAAATFFRKWLRDLASDQRPDGGVPFVVPDVLTPLSDKDPFLKNTHSSTGWGDAAVICPWTVYRRYGDLRVLEEQYPSMRAWVELIRARAQDGLIWNEGFHFGDWVALDAKEGSYFGATPNDLTATAFYAHSTDLLAQTAAALGKDGEAAGYQELHRSIVRAFREEFYTPSGRLAARTQTAHVLALVFGLTPEAHRERTVHDLVALIRENGDHLTTGFLGTPFLCQALADGGRLDVAYQLLLRTEYPSWLYQVTRGATTIWEHWDGLKPDGTLWSARMNSFNHYAYGAVGAWMYRTVAGLDLEASDPIEGSFVLNPRPGGGIRSCRTTYRSLYGDLTLAWSHADGQLRLEATVPPNTTARLVLDGVAPKAVRAEAAVEAEPGRTIVRLGAGTHTVSCPLPGPAGVP